MEKIKVLIVEDKLLIAEDIAQRLEKHSLEVIDTCSSGEEAIEKAKSKNPDLILMDIELSGAMDGISAAQIISQQLSVPIIYLSDYTDNKTLDRAKKTQPANYLTKPFNEADLIRAIDLAFSNAKHAPVTINRTTRPVFMRTESQVYLKLDMQEILYLEADRSYCKVITTTRTFTLSTSMNNVYDQLNHEDFIKVHRSYIVNVSRITSLEGNSIKIGETEIQMSKEYRDDLMGLLKIIR
jgi:DNA-binding LytR/AlgR family response regulator